MNFLNNTERNESKTPNRQLSFYTFSDPAKRAWVLIASQSGTAIFIKTKTPKS